MTKTLDDIKNLMTQTEPKDLPDIFAFDKLKAELDDCLKENGILFKAEE